MFEIEIRVDYADTDAMGVAHHASYFRWLERARVEWLRQLGLSYAQMEADGYIMPLKGAEIRYRGPLRFDEIASVKLKVSELSRTQVSLMYTIEKDGMLITTAQTFHVLCRKQDDGKLSPVRIPQDWRKLWELQSEKKN